MHHRGIRWRGAGRENPSGAKFRRDDLYDDVQLAIGGLPDELPCARNAADQRGDDDQQREREHGVPTRVFDPADILSERVLAHTATCFDGAPAAGTDYPSPGAVSLARREDAARNGAHGWRHHQA